MYNFTSFDKDAFYKDMREKNYSVLKTCVISSIRNNPAFRKAPGEEYSEARIAMNLLQEHVPEMFVEYEVQAGEREYNAGEASAWDKEYFHRQTFLLGENFCWERFRHLLKIGQEITEQTASNFQYPQDMDRAKSGSRTFGQGIRQILHAIMEGIRRIVRKITMGTK